jgi:hypothetical protein
MTLHEFVNEIAERTNHHIRFKNVPERVAGPFCECCFDEASELTPIRFNGELNTWDCDKGHSFPTHELPLPRTIRT